MLEQFRISDFLEWHEAKGLKLNPDFQRGSVWTPAARIMLIDTILRDLPIPKIFIRSKIDRVSRKTVREVVDGQQRLRAIIDFASDKITLSQRAKEYSGFRFSSLPDELKDRFLEYPLAVDQLINATDDKVLDIFARLNSYNVKLNAPELRHAAYQGDFRSSVHDLSVANFEFWNTSRIFSYRDMVRMENDALVAEMYTILLEGISDGGAEKINRIYKKYDIDNSFNKELVEGNFQRVMNFIEDSLAPRLIEAQILKPPHLLILFAAVAHSIIGLVKGGLDELPERRPLSQDTNLIADRLSNLSAIIVSKEEPENMKDFWRASRSTTQRLASRKERFTAYYEAVTA
jgi:Protein of unknown function DUF262